MFFILCIWWVVLCFLLVSVLICFFCLWIFFLSFVCFLCVLFSLFWRILIWCLVDLVEFLVFFSCVFKLLMMVMVLVWMVLLCLVLVGLLFLLLLEMLLRRDWCFLWVVVCVEIGVLVCEGWVLCVVVVGVVLDVLEVVGVDDFVFGCCGVLVGVLWLVVGGFLMMVVMVGRLVLWNVV